MEPVSPGTSSAARIAAISGLVFAVLFVVALVLLHRAPTLGDPDATYATFYARGGDKLFVAIGLYLVPFAGIAFLWHMTAIRDVLDTLTPGAVGDGARPQPAGRGRLRDPAVRGHRRRRRGRASASTSGTPPSRTRRWRGR